MFLNLVTASTAPKAQTWTLRGSGKVVGNLYSVSTKLRLQVYVAVLCVKGGQTGRVWAVLLFAFHLDQHLGSGAAPSPLAEGSWNSLAEMRITICPHVPQVPL